MKQKNVANSMGTAKESVSSFIAEGERLGDVVHGNRGLLKTHLKLVCTAFTRSVESSP